MDEHFKIEEIYKIMYGFKGDIKIVRQKNYADIYLNYQYEDYSYAWYYGKIVKTSNNIQTYDAKKHMVLIINRY